MDLRNISNATSLIFLVFIQYVQSRLVILGMHSMCFDKQNKSELNIMAKKSNQLIENILRKDRRLSYQVHDTCDEADVIKTFMNIFLSDDYISSMDTLLMILAFLSDSMSYLLYNLNNAWDFDKLPVLILIISRKFSMI